MAALRVLVLNSEIAALRAQLAPLEKTRDGFAAREEQLRQALSEITEASTDEERSVFGCGYFRSRAQRERR